MKRCFPWMVAGLVCSLAVGARGEPKRPPYPASVRAADRSEVLISGTFVRVPGGWQRVPMSAPDSSVVFFKRKNSTIAAYLYKGSEIKLGPRDSRRPRYYASRYAKAWNLPLRPWRTSVGTRIFETLQKYKKVTIYILSASSGQAEAAFVVHVRPPVSVASARQAVYMLLKTSQVGPEAAKLFPGLGGSAPLVGAAVSFPKGGALVEQIGRYKITMPKGVYMDDLAVPYTAGSNMQPHPVSTLSLQCISEAGDVVGGISLFWLEAKEGSAFKSRESQLRKLQRTLKQRNTAAKYLSIPGLMVEPMGKTHASYIYVSSQLALTARMSISLVPEHTVKNYEPAVLDLVDQFRRQAE